MTDSPRPDDRPGSGSALGNCRRGMLAAYLLLLLVLIVGSDTRRVGDGGEYLGMAQDLARLAPPSMHAHFWFYSALAAPILPFVHLAGFKPLAAFTPLNLMMLGSAFWLASRVFRWPALLLIFVRRRK